MRKNLLIIFSFFITGFSQAQVKPLQVSANKRYFQTTDGKPFFWLGDTGWLLFVKNTREEIIHYLDTRQKQGFNVIQAMVLHELSVAKNVYGDSALVNRDVSTPRLTTGNNFRNKEQYDYWDHIDFVVDEAAKRGIYMALVPVWGSNVKGGQVNVKQARAYAQYLATRYRNKTNIIWLNGGDIKGSDSINVWKTIGNTLKKYDPNHLVTFHPRGRNSSSEWFHKEAWLDFNMFQSGHRNYSQDTSSNEILHYGEDNWKYMNTDYQLKPVKPSLDGEPSYENIPQGLHDSLQPRWTAADLRRYAYWSVFSGAAGFTYGENAVMQFHSSGDKDANYGVTGIWKETIAAPGATQMHLLSELMYSKPYFDRVPAQQIILNNTGSRYDRLVATMGKTFVFVYTYSGKNFSIDLSRIKFPTKKASWFNPTIGTRQAAGAVSGKKTMEFDPPGEPANGNDWVLILE